MTRTLTLALLLTGCSSFLAVAPRDHVTHDTRDGIERSEWVWQGTRDFWLFARAWRATDPTAVVILVHGLRDHSARYEAFATSLAQHGFAVYAYDHRGHGRSDGQGQMVDAFDDYLIDLHTFVTEVRTREPNRPLFLFGHSMGGAIATMYAETRDPQLAGVVLSAPALRHHVDDVQHAFLDLSSVMFPYVGLLSLEEHDFTRDAAALTEMQRDPLIHHESGPARTAAELLSAIGHIRGWFDGIRVPVLVIHGVADRVTMPEGSEDLIHGATTSPDRTLWRCDGMFHDLLHEPEHAALGDAIRSWMESRRDGPHPSQHDAPPDPCHDATPVGVIPAPPAP
jgi:alpha-beta hydrolase superfamily lysophospholipase